MDEILKGKLGEVIKKVQADPSLLQKILGDPAKSIKELTGLDIPQDQLKNVTAAIQAGKLDLDGVDLSDGIDMKDVTGVAGKLGGLFGK